MCAPRSWGREREKKKEAEKENMHVPHPSALFVLMRYRPSQKHNGITTHQIHLFFFSFLAWFGACRASFLLFMDIIPQPPKLFFRLDWALFCRARSSPDSVPWCLVPTSNTYLESNLSASIVYSTRHIQSTVLQSSVGVASRYMLPKYYLIQYIHTPTL